MRAVRWSCVAIVCLFVGDALGCGGRLEVADCGQGRQYCAQTNVCCPNFTTCGNGTNGCPPGDCCLNTTSHIVDGGSDGPSATELPAPTGGYYDPSDPDPGGVPGNAGGGGGVGPASGHGGNDKHL